MASTSSLSEHNTVDLEPQPSVKHSWRSSMKPCLVATHVITQSFYIIQIFYAYLFSKMLLQQATEASGINSKVK